MYVCCVKLGQAWEAFALVCEGQTDSADTLFGQLAHRGYSRAEYAAALDELARRSWLDQADETGTYRVTKTGRAMHEEAERLTDEYFYAPWSHLTEEQFATVHNLLIRLQEISA